MEQKITVIKIPEIKKEVKFKEQFKSRKKPREKQIRNNTGKKKKQTHKRNIIKKISPPTEKNLMVEFQGILQTKDSNKINYFIKKIKKDNLTLICFSLHLIKKRKTRAPVPLLKNILYNFITSDINIIL